jgi:hypothetical protein
MQDGAVKNIERKDLFGHSRWIVVGSLVFISVLVGLLIHWQPGKTVQRQQAALIRAIESGKSAKFRRLLAADYKDRWGFNPANLSEAITDVGSQFMIMRLTPETPVFEVKGGKATVTAHLKVGGNPIGGGAQIMQVVNRLGEPFVFTWEKQNFLPSSWRLVSIENPAIPENAWNYVPGSIRAAMKGGEF